MIAAELKILGPFPVGACVGFRGGDVQKTGLAWCDVAVSLRGVEDGFSGDRVIGGRCW